MKVNENNRYIISLIEFMNQCSCSFTTVKSISKQLDDCGFIKLSCSDKWSLKSGDKFYVTPNDSAIFAFSLGSQSIQNGFKVIAAHSDSPTFKIKPNGIINSEGNVVKLNTEPYGGGILNTWYDRPLSISGRVILKGESAFKPITRIIKIDKPIMIIPQLPIHFNRAVNDGVKISKQKDMLPICGVINDSAERENLILHLIAKELEIEIGDIIDFDLSLYCTEKATLVGINDDFVTSGRLDDLSMVHAATTAFIEIENSDSNNILAIFDNEETGSGTKQGAGSP
ncbi:MAG: M18 family aminopeptidase, partial [Bacteroidales bacterium]